MFFIVLCSVWGHNIQNGVSQHSHLTEQDDLCLSLLFTLLICPLHSHKGQLIPKLTQHVALRHLSLQIGHSFSEHVHSAFLNSIALLQSFSQNCLVCSILCHVIPSREEDQQPQCHSQVCLSCKKLQIHLANRCFLSCEKSVVHTPSEVLMQTFLLKGF